MGSSSSVPGSQVHRRQLTVDDLPQSSSLGPHGSARVPSSDRVTQNPGNVLASTDMPIEVRGIFNSLEDYTTALKIQAEHPKMIPAFTGMQNVTRHMWECQRTKWDWVRLELEFETHLDSMYYTFYQEKKKLGRYLSLLKFTGPLAKAYASAMKEKKLKSFTVRDIRQESDSVIDFLIAARSILLNYTDSSLQFCERVSESGVLKFFVEDLKVASQHLEDFNNDPDDNYIASMGTLYNCSRNPVTRITLRQLNTVLELLPFLGCKSSKVRLIVLLTLANVVDEDQNHLFAADGSIFDFLLQTLELAWTYHNHRWDGFSVEELLDGMTGLAKNDSNKSVCVEKGVVSFLMKVLSKSKLNEEREKAVKCVWELAFDKENRKKFMENEELMELLKTSRDSEDKGIAKAAAGALWVLELKDKPKLNESSASEDVTLSGHVMISYQWGDQKTMLQVKESLRGTGYRVWMDVDNMGGSTLQAMAEAVQNASVILVCMSERYKESQNCRSEAEYAFSLQKIIIPLLMQRDYKPDGWLGIIKGTKLFFDFSGKYEYEMKVNDLAKELGNKGKSISEDVVDGPVKTSVAMVKSAPSDAGKGPRVADWSKKDIQNWLVKNGLDSSRQSTLNSLTGDDLLFLRKMSYKAPEFYFNYLKEELHLKALRDIRQFSEAIEKLI